MFEAIVQPDVEGSTESIMDRRPKAGSSPPRRGKESPEPSDSPLRNSEFRRVEDKAFDRENHTCVRNVLHDEEGWSRGQGEAEELDAEGHIEVSLRISTTELDAWRTPDDDIGRGKGGYRSDVLEPMLGPGMVSLVAREGILIQIHREDDFMTCLSESLREASCSAK